MSHKVLIYSTPTCPYCHQAKAYLKEKGVEFTDYNVADDEKKLKR
jgi:glutaredoxin